MAEVIDIADLKSGLIYDTHDMEEPLSSGHFRYDSSLGEFGGLVRPNADDSVLGLLSMFPFTECGFESLCKTIEGNRKFLMSLQPEVRDGVINAKLADSIDKTMHIRCIKDDDQYHIRAIITRNWVQFDNVDVVSTLQPMLETHSMRVEDASFDNYKMDLRLVFDDDAGPDDDKVNVGLSIINDECTSKPLSVDLFLFRQSESSGTIVKYKSQNIGSIPHARITSENFASRLSMILTAVQPHIQYLINSFASLKDQAIDPNTLDRMPSKWQKYYGIPQSMLTDSLKGIPTTYYEFMNGVSIAARDAGSMNVRRRGETAAGNILMDMLKEGGIDMGKFNDVFVKRGRGRPRKQEA